MGIATPARRLGRTGGGGGEIRAALGGGEEGSSDSESDKTIGGGSCSALFSPCIRCGGIELQVEVEGPSLLVLEVEGVVVLVIKDPPSSLLVFAFFLTIY